MSSYRGVYRVRKNAIVFVMGLIVLTIAPVYAKEAEQQPGDYASESEKNEIPICKKPVPIDVGISPEFIVKNRAEMQKTEEKYGEGSGRDLVKLIHQYEVTKRVEYAVACEIERLGYVAAKPFSVKANISDFSLRSSGTVVSSAIVPIAGALNSENRPDRLAVMFDVFATNDDKPYQFSVRDSTRKGGFFNAAPSQRLNNMVKSVTKDVIKKLLKAGIIAEPYAITSGSQPLSMTDFIANGNREVLLRITASLSKQNEPVDVEILDKVADRIYRSQSETDGGMADTLAHMCKLLGKSKNGKYKQMLREVSEKAAHSTLRKHAAKSADQLPDTGEQQYSPLKGAT